MSQTAESVWKECLEIIRDNVSRQSFRTWFSPLKPLRLEEEGALTKLTVQLPSRFYFEWLEEHYFGLLRKTITKVLGPDGRLFYDVVIEQDNEESGFDGTVMKLPARQPANEPQPMPASGRAPVPAADEPPANTGFGRPPAPPSGFGAAQPYTAHTGISNPFVIPGIQKVQVESHLNRTIRSTGSSKVTATAWRARLRWPSPNNPAAPVSTRFFFTVVLGLERPI